MGGIVKTAVDMANRALAELEAPPLQSFEGADPKARWFRANYETFRDELLALHDWDFALSLVRLPADTIAPPYRWAHQYTLPADMLRLPVQRADGSAHGKRLQYEVIGRKLMADVEPPFRLRYVRRVASEFEFSAAFVNAFAFYLAAGCCHVVTSKNSLKQTLQEQARRAIAEARLQDARQSGVRPQSDFDVEAMR